MTRGVLLGRAGFGALGVGALAYGAWLVWGLGSTQWLAVGKWLAGGVIAHDLLFAPVVVLVGVIAARRLPSYARAPVAIAVVVWGSITLFAIPFLGRFGANATNPTLLDRPYRLSWLIGLVVVAAAVVVASLLRRRRER
ncbi:MAG: hypothetical protein H0V48_06800 [Nocardioidaceae bacterium]|nr:hypothetical protein [Nocardioidaceae bacterium]MDQ3165302.1 hypothetical protein [Actinomycetota bacterium]